MTQDVFPDVQAAAQALTNEDGLLSSVMWICERYGCGKTAEALTAGLPKSGMLSPSLALGALSNAGLTAGLVERHLQLLPGHVLPVILLHRRMGGCVLVGRRANPDREAKKPHFVPGDRAGNRLRAGGVHPRGNG